MDDTYCANCIYWAGHDGDDAGECRRHSPRPRPAEEVAYWPIVEADDWCGEWEEGGDICTCDPDNGEACLICEPDAQPASVDEAFNAIIATLNRRHHWWQRKPRT